MTDRTPHGDVHPRFQVPRETLNMEAIKPKRLDWPRILKDMKEAGYSLYQISRLLEKSESTVHSWWRGHEPSHSNGESILKLHMQVCGEQATKDRTETAAVAA